MQWFQIVFLFLGNLSLFTALPWLEDQVDWNLNTNETAKTPLEYWGEWPQHTYYPSPDNWRMPFYTITLDRFVNGDPTNDEANGTQWEHDITSNQFRFGGDLIGLVDNLDYIQGLGIKALYLAGSPMINMPWASDGYSPLDLTMLDHHHGVIEDWRTAISEIHARGMYVILDNTMATMGDLIGFEGYLNESTPFAYDEHDFIWKNGRRYWDFQPDNSVNESCEYPVFYFAQGYQIGSNITSKLTTCRASEFDQYGEVSAFGDDPDWVRQLSKFAFVQDRLREWQPDVRAKIDLFSCITIAMLDIDGFRIDKALQVTIDAQAAWSSYIRQCARNFNKTNFFIPGEVVDGNIYGAVYHGRGKLEDMAISNLTEAVMATNETNTTSGDLYIRDFGNSALDSAAFHYSIYRALTRFLGMDGHIGAVGDTDYDVVTAWHEIVQTNDLVNANTGKYDPRHMFGVTNQDVFRYPGLTDGTQRQLLGLFVTTLILPGIPLLVWGEEQAFYIMDNQASNYVFGRQPMASNQAWQMHGCYKLNEVWYNDMPLDSALTGCYDDNVSLDHRDPSSPVHGIIKRMYQLRAEYPVLNDGFELTQLSNMTYELLLPGSNNPTEFGVRSVYRSRTEGVQDFTGQGQGNQGVWLVYQNDNKTINYTFNCSSPTEALLSPFAHNTTVKNLFRPYETYELSESNKILGFDGNTTLNGCIDSITMAAYEYKALVPIEAFVEPMPIITRVLPGHDSRIQSRVSSEGSEVVPIEIHFSANMSCQSVKDSLYFNASTHNGVAAKLDEDSVNCLSVVADVPKFIGGVPTAWIFKANLTDVYNGVHTFTIHNAMTNASSASVNTSTNAVDHFMFRIGQNDNPLVYPKSADYSRSLLHQNASTGDLYVVANAAGADKYRYSLNWGSSWSNWTDYDGDNVTLTPQSWSGTSKQKWTGEHVVMQYWSRLTGSADHVQHGDLLTDGQYARRFPHFFAQGSWNQFGYDAGLPQTMSLVADGMWEFNFMAEWPNTVAFNVWGINPDGLPDMTTVFGDIDGDGVLDRVPPITLLELNITLAEPPPMPYLSYKLTVNDSTLGYRIIPLGSAWHQLILFILFAIVPVITGLAAVFLFKQAFYQVKHNYIGVSEKEGLLNTFKFPILNRSQISGYFKRKPVSEVAAAFSSDDPLAMAAGAANRRKVLIATMEYEIEDWAIKIKIGGLGVMASLMGKNLGHQDLIWVVPCVGGIDYPVDQCQEPMTITILGQSYDIGVQTHVVRNVTYVLLDAPVFRNQNKAEPYPPRMDDVESAIYYSAWNSCIAETIKRFDPDIYHINDYHGAVAPLHLLPRTIPVCLSLHNAEFQGLWPMRTEKEIEEVGSIYNLQPEVVKKYVQYGEVFNLLHAGASYLRVHQKGFGAVGVSKKYGVRSFARYPIFWGLSKVGALPNPDPSDTAEWDRAAAAQGLGEVGIDKEAEAARGERRVQAQQWAGLKVDLNAELFVFVGRWSMQKGIDLIADVFPAVLEENSNTQLICVGPVIDLYGKFAAMKLEKMMQKYPGRVCSKPVFTALPPFIFSGAEFALIPSRDEPFGLVAVEFGRKGALGVGARVGGLGQMPGWWFTIESTTTRHLMRQFKTAIKHALASKTEVRAMMRARSALQRFPVAQWVEDLETLQSTSIKVHHKYNEASDPNSTAGLSGFARSMFTPSPRPSLSIHPLGASTRQHSRESSVDPSNSVQSSWFGPGRKLTKSNIPSLNSSRSQSRDRGGTHSREVSSGSARLELPTMKDFKKKPRRSRNPFLVGADDESENEVELGRPGGHSRNNSYGMSPMSANTPVSGDRSPLPRSGNQTPLPGSRRLLGPSVAASHVSLRDLADEIQSSHDDADSFVPPFAVDRNERTLSSSGNSVLSLDSVVGNRRDFKLQVVDPFFTDSTGMYGNTFESMLEDLNGKSCEGQLCLEEFLVKSEKQWFGRFHDAKLGRSPGSPASSVFRMPWGNRSTASDLVVPSRNTSMMNVSTPMLENPEDARDFALHEDYTAPTGLRKFLQQKLGDWPVYAFLLAFGQIIAANSYQITLLIGQNGEAASELYTVASIYLFGSACWWLVFRQFKAIYVLSTPFFFYGTAFFLVGMVPYLSSAGSSRAWMQNLATAFYAIASSSGSLFFANNFGSEGGAPIESWAFRACVIQGTQQIYVSALWYWGSRITKIVSSGGSTSSLFTAKKAVTAITTPIALLLWAVGVILYLCLPNYYRQKPGTTPSFYHSILRRKIILWFLVVVIIQNYWLSAPYGRSWAYLWSSSNTPTWSIVLLILIFFIGIWAALLWIFGHYSKSHSWILPLFAIGLGAPRWCQMLWGISNIGLYVPWAGSAAASALVGRGLWLWLGVLDAIQGVGFGMILLQTLTRFHISFTLIMAQVIGSLATIAARASAPNKIGPGAVFPDFSGGLSGGLREHWFWIGLLFQMVVCVGFFTFFRKEQLFKP